MKIILFANTDWFLYHFNLSLAQSLRDSGHDVLLLSPRGQYSRKLVSLGFRWREAPLSRSGINPVLETRFVFWLRRLLSAEAPDVVHAFTLKCAIYAGLAARLGRVPALISELTGFGYVFSSSDLKARLLRPVLRALMRMSLNSARGRVILLNRDDVKNAVVSKIIKPQLIRLVPGSGVDCARFAPCRPSRSGVPPFRVLLPARVLWDKGVAEFADAAKQLKLDGEPIEFLLAGPIDEGNPAAVPESAVRGWESAGYLTWMGHVQDMPALLQTVDLVVLPTYREGLPTALIEAASCGLATIATDVPGCRDVIDNEANGLLIPVKSSVALAAAIRRLFHDSELRGRLGRAARQKTIENFDTGVVLARRLAVYFEVLEDNPSGTRER